MTKMHKIIHITATCVILAIVIFTLLFIYIPRLSYSYDETTDSYFVTGAYGDAKSYYIPKSYKDKNVTAIGERAFYNHKNLVTIEFECPENIILIERLAFSECDKLEYINLEFVKNIERNAFAYDYSLNNLKIGAENIGSAAFLNCNNLSCCEILTGNITIGSEAFMGCSIAELSIPSTTIKIYNDAFYGLDITLYIKGDNLKSNEYVKTLNCIFED